MTELSWGLPVVGYLFLAGLGAGALTTSASVLLRGGPNGTYYDIARIGAFLAPIPVMLGCGLLVFELGSFEVGNWFRWLNLYMVINLSPMSIGTWLLTIFIGVSVLYAYTFWPDNGLANGNNEKLRRTMAWMGIPLGIGVAVYTGILLGAMPARPFWNSPILALLFLLSAISTGIASIMLIQAIMHRNSDKQTNDRYHESSYILTTTDTLLIGLELMTIFLFIMYAHLTIGNVKEAISVILFGGALAPMFWFWVVLIGLIIPASIELLLILPKLLHKKDFLPKRHLEILIPVLVLVGGFMLRYVVVIAGQITHPMGI